MEISYLFELLSKVIVFNTGKFILSLFGVKQVVEEEKDPLRIKTLDEVRNSTEVTGKNFDYELKAKQIGFLFYFILIILAFLAY